MVSAVLPEFTPSIIDRYLIACEDMGIEPILVLNKIDLIDDAGLSEIQKFSISIVNLITKYSLLVIYRVMVLMN